MRHSLPVDIRPLGDSAVLVRIADRIDEASFRQVQALTRQLQAHWVDGFVEMVPAFLGVAVHYDPAKLSWEQVSKHVRQCASTLESSIDEPSRVVEIPVCYGGEHGADLDLVCRHAGLSAKQVIELHTSTPYLVHMIGFAPGFPYLGGMPARLATPRRASPRLKIPAGSVGIAGGQTGVYPIETPGGWQLIGRTPLALFRPWDDPPSLLRAGDTVRFRAIDEVEFHKLWEHSR